MKIIISSIFILFFNIVGCKNNILTENQINKIIFRTDKSSYLNSDTVKIILANESNNKISIGLRCGIYLEMYYQKKENEVWTDNIPFWYMSLRCLTIIDTLEKGNNINFDLNIDRFISIGEYRLVLNFYDINENKDIVEYSNSFEIKF